MRYSFKSAFAPHIIGLIQQKQADGFIYHSNAVLLKKFDTFCLSRFPDTDVISRDIVAEWAVIRSTEGKNYRNSRMYALRQLCLYILSLGLEAYVPHDIGSNDKSVLYIPSQEELSLFFKQLDSWISPTQVTRRIDIECRVMFRLYYCCGLRLSEVRFLRKEDVDFENGILTILNSKGHKDRLVYLPLDGITQLCEYRKVIENIAPETPLMFPGQILSHPLSCSTIERRFENCWNRLPFSQSTDKRPTPHCLRHAFVVERLNDWMRQGISLNEMLPYLSKFLGHKSPSETYYYYHLVNKAFSIVRQKDKVSNRVIPEVFNYEGNY